MNTTYRVFLSNTARCQLQQITDYLDNVLQNRQALLSFRKYTDDTIMRLSKNADGLALCRNAELAQYGYRIIHYRKLKYMMIYRIIEDRVWIDSVFHSSQNYESYLV